MKDQHRMAIRNLIERINSSWKNKQFDGLAECFHPEMVIAGPRYHEFARGKEACVESYREFAASAVVHEYTESSPLIEIWNNTAVCAYSWNMVYQRGQEVSRESGTDQYVLLFDGMKWLAVWRLVLFEPSK